LRGFRQSDPLQNYGIKKHVDAINEIPCRNQTGNILVVSPFHLKKIDVCRHWGTMGNHHSWIGKKHNFETSQLGEIHILAPQL
jgi:hypothetical protein